MKRFMVLSILMLNKLSGVPKSGPNTAYQAKVRERLVPNAGLRQRRHRSSAMSLPVAGG